MSFVMCKYFLRFMDFIVSRGSRINDKDNKDHLYYLRCNNICINLCMRKDKCRSYNRNGEFIDRDGAFYIEFRDFNLQRFGDHPARIWQGIEDINSDSYLRDLCEKIYNKKKLIKVINK